MYLSQEKYIEEVLENFDMEDCKPRRIPMGSADKLVKGSDDQERADKTMYQSAVGSLMFISQMTRPDITFAVHQVAQFAADPTTGNWTAVKNIFRYLKGTKDLALRMRKEDSKTVTMTSYSDADWAGCQDTRRSTSGVVVKIGESIVIWRSVKQKYVAQSTLEAEYVAGSLLAREVEWTRHLLAELGEEQVAETEMFIDNKGAIDFGVNEKVSSRTKHIDLRRHYLKDLVENKVVRMTYVRTEDQIADILTKPLPRERFEKLRSMLGITRLEGEVLRIGRAGDEACEEETLAQRRGDDLRSGEELRAKDLTLPPEAMSLGN
jgi:hypothetical protein